MMKLRTTIFISIFCSSIVIKAQVSDEDYEDEQYNDEENTIGTSTVQFKPSIRLKEIENNLSGSLKEFVKDGNVKETLTKTFLNSMNTETAIEGFSKLNQEFQHMVNGPEASWVIGTFGGNLNKIFTSPEGADMINMITSTFHMLFKKAGERNVEDSSLGKLFSSMFSLFTSPQMPAIIDKTGELAIAAVNKPMASLFVRQWWNEWQKLFSEKDLDKKIGNSFASLSALMKNLNNQRARKTR